MPCVIYFTSIIPIILEIAFSQGSNNSMALLTIWGIAGAFLIKINHK